jgi:hypothetical protein
MRSAVLSWNGTGEWTGAQDFGAPIELVIAFGARCEFEQPDWLAPLRRLAPQALILGCSTGGQIAAADVLDKGVRALALRFDRTPLRMARAIISDQNGSHAAGADIGAQLAGADLSAIFILSDGLRVNGTDLVAGLRAGVGADVAISGGLAGDGADFARTLVCAGAEIAEGQIAAVGFYGAAVRIGHGHGAGWTPFGSRRAITRAQGNVLYELDGKPALDLYKSYLGDEAEGLPGAGLLYPLAIRDPAAPDTEIIRTILSVDHEARAMTFAGDVPQGWSAQLMRGYFDRLTEAAAAAANAAMEDMGQDIDAAGDRAALLVSCIGRRIMMGENVVEEIEAAHSALAGVGSIVGFYSYGEISPQVATGACDLHNQTMTVTTFAEVA